MLINTFETNDSLHSEDEVSFKAKCLKPKLTYTSVTDKEYSGRVIVERGVLLPPKRIARAIADNMSRSCGCDHCPCGCWNRRVTVKHVGKREYRVNTWAFQSL